MSAPQRAQASKIAKWLVERSRSEEAIELLCAMAVSGPNDIAGQQLLADAFRINPASPIARMAFERMEGVAGDQGPLDHAVATYSDETISRLLREMTPNVFRRAQMGFNNNLKYKGEVFHVQTEDSGLDKPHIITHLFADGGRVIRSYKRDYAAEVTRPEVDKYVKALMKGQHMEMVLNMREGKFDDIIAGTARAGAMEVLTEAPRTDVQKVAKRTKSEDKLTAVSASKSMPPPPSTSASPATVSAPPRLSRPVPYYVLFVERSLHGGPDHYPVFGHETVIGSTGELTLSGERFCHPQEAMLRYIDGQLFVEDLPGGNGIFLRIRSRVEVGLGDEFVIGDNLFRLDPNVPPTDDHPDPGPTYFYPAPNWASVFRVTQIFEGGATGRCCVSRGGSVQIGAAVGDIIVADPLVSDQHCMVEEQAGSFVLTDLESRTGVFIRLSPEDGPLELVEGDEILVGRTRLRVHFTMQK